MVIGVDAREFAGSGGKARYVREIVTRLPRLAPKTQFTMYGTPPPGLAVPDNVRWCEIRGGKVTWHWRAARHANQHCDLYFSTVSYLTPKFLHIPYVQTIFDLVTFQDFKVAQRKAKLIETKTLHQAVGKAYKVITISEATKADLVKEIPEAKKKTTAIPLAADSHFGPRPADHHNWIRERYELPERFILNTGTIEPRKNLVRLIKAHAALPAKLRKAVPLVLVGGYGWGYADIKKAVSKHGSVRHLTHVGDADLADLYATATLFAYPSLYEGFGLPPLEAMQSGTAVVTSRVSSLPEVGGRAVRYVDPDSTESIRKALAELLGSAAKRNKLAKAGQRRAKRFSWDKTVQATAKVLGAK